MSLLKLIGLKPHAVVAGNSAQAASQRLVRKVEQGAYEEAELMLSSANDESRERLIYGFGVSSGSVPLAATWAKACSRSSLAHTVLGASLITTGWNIRGSSYAKDVDSAAWKPFLDSLKDAKEPLHIAARLDSASADPYAWLIHAELGGDASREHLSRLFSEAISRAPLHWPAHYKYFTATTQKWGGSHREMFKFSQEASRHAPRGSIIHSLVASSYNEYVLAHGRDGLKKIRSKEHADKVSAALYAWLDANPSTLGQKLENPNGSFFGYGLNQFAVACYACGATNEAKETISALNGEIETIPWVWIANGLRERMNPGFVHDRIVRDLGKSA
ncbi:hypothetical protein [Acidovorax sp.]|uniref:hypothetical protein n=1 Tax=Acidovorax sp. TaxID=1872122 RepID=UPI00262B0880|nr:hypothetical protein [Acidovorax sp.]